MSATYGSCITCKFCHQFKGIDRNGNRVTVYYCRKNAPVPSQSALVASSDMMVVTKGLWPSVDPDIDGCAEFVESSFV
jgi:hypothetical protein